jgi:hypothetical protein
VATVYTCRISRKVSGLVQAQCVEVEATGTGYTKGDAMDSLRSKLGDILRVDKPLLVEASDSPLGGFTDVTVDISQETYDKVKALATRLDRPMEQVAGEALARAVRTIPELSGDERQHWLASRGS